MGRQVCESGRDAAVQQQTAKGHEMKEEMMAETQKSEIEKVIYEETEKRLGEMGAPGYTFPERITRGDVTGIAVLFAASLLLIILCMTGVIR